MGLYLELLGFEVAKCDSFVEVGMVDSLERANSLRRGGVIAVIV